MSFDFGKAVSSEGADDLGAIEAYHPPTSDVLPSGNYVVKITDIDNVTSSGGYPMLKMRLENEQGVQWDNLVISPAEFSVAKLLGLIDSAGLPRPDASKNEIDPEDGRLSEDYVYMLNGKTVGVIIRDEEDNRPEYAGQMRPRVKGYVDPGVLSGSNTGPMFSPQANANPAPANSSPSRSPLAF